jgi:hypothetical protein
MSDALSTAPTGVEAEAPTAEIETEGQDTPEVESPETLASGEGEEGESEQQEVVEEIEFDFGGNKKKWPKGTPIDQIADELHQFTKGTWSDYTRKSQEAVERLKSVETREKVVEKLSTLNNEALDTYSRGLAVRQEIEQLQKHNLNALWQSQDPTDRDRARFISDTLAAKQAEFQNIVGKVNQLEGQMTQTQQQEAVRRADEGRQVVEKAIPGFTSKHLPEVIDYVVKNYGIPKDVAERDWPYNPGTTLMAHKAMLYDRMQAQAKAAARSPTPKPQQQTAPITPVRGKGGTAVKSPNQMSVSEMAKHLGVA